MVQQNLRSFFYKIVLIQVCPFFFNKNEICTNFKNKNCNLIFAMQEVDFDRFCEIKMNPYKKKHNNGIYSDSVIQKR